MQQHIQSLLIERAERAAQRILFLQGRVTYLEEELQENDSEVSYLRLCLKAVEVQVPREGVDPYLVQSIRNFKEDWALAKEKRTAQRDAIAASANMPPMPKDRTATQGQRLESILTMNWAGSVGSSTTHTRNWTGSVGSSTRRWGASVGPATGGAAPVRNWSMSVGPGAAPPGSVGGGAGAGQRRTARRSLYV